MRLSPIPIAFHNDLNLALKSAKEQSLTTHDGKEAYGCCQLLTELVIKFINRPQNDQRSIKEIMDNFRGSFDHEIMSVKFLGQSQPETQEMIQQCPRAFNRSVNDRNWRWVDPNYQYSLFRSLQQPGYIGSYCMDALSMALHIAYYSKSFKDAVFTAANMGGDSDTVGAIVGIITGAYYGLTEDLLELYQYVNKWDHYDFPLKAYKLFYGINVQKEEQKGKDNYQTDQDSNYEQQKLHEAKRCEEEENKKNFDLQQSEEKSLIEKNLQEKKEDSQKK
eukprot:TRINITY_DN993_c0_g1_i1.p1 TRINITY_DN993_c0_g1~~TRINITY_DN993_c0_g1_i1.p1  ORF type:complete len:277 (+),score=45.37 TRINITY_DN993_c0_g1_i1:392-1222(+)